MKILPQNSNGLRGNTLFVVLIITGVVGFVLTAYLTMLRRQNTTTMRSQAWNSSIPVVEAGVEEAMTHLNAHGTTNLACDGWTQSGTVYYLQRWVGANYYIVTISNWVANMTNLPIIESRGFVNTPILTASANQPFLADLVGGSTATTNYLGRGVRCGAKQVYLFTKAMVAKGNINLSGQNVFTDSFDSGDTNYSTNARYDINKRKPGGDVATDSSLTNSFAVGNANIYGHVSTGPGGSVSIGINGVVGDFTYGSTHRGSIEPGWRTDDMNVDFPDVVLPYTVGMVPISGSVGGVSYNYVLGTGNYVLQSGTLSGTVIVTGNANLVIAKGAGIKMSGGSDTIIIQTNASLNLYVDTPTATINGQGVQNAGLANQFYYWGTPNNTTLNYGGNSAFTGVFYAPSAAFSLGGGGSTIIDFAGSSITGSIKMNGNYTFHYDESLGKTGKIRGFVVTSWNEMTPPEVRTLPAGIGTISSAGVYSILH
jgi:hypothetical protein